MAKEGRFAENRIGGRIAKTDGDVDGMHRQRTEYRRPEQYLERAEEAAG